MAAKFHHLSFKSLITLIALPMLIVSLGKAVCASNLGNGIDHQAAGIHIDPAESQSAKTHDICPVLKSESFYVSKTEEMTNKWKSGNTQPMISSEGVLLHAFLSAFDDSWKIVQSLSSQIPLFTTQSSLFAQKTALLIYQA